MAVRQCFHPPTTSQVLVRAMFVLKKGKVLIFFFLEGQGFYNWDIPYESMFCSTPPTLSYFKNPAIAFLRPARWIYDLGSVFSRISRKGWQPAPAFTLPKPGYLEGEPIFLHSKIWVKAIHPFMCMRFWLEAVSNWNVEGIALLWFSLDWPCQVPNFGAELAIYFDLKNNPIPEHGTIDSNLAV